MNAFYNLVSGPLVWVAFALFLGGSVWKVWSLLAQTKKTDGYVFTYWSWKHALNSYLHWLVPFMSVNSQKQPVMSVVTFLFHLGIVLVPLFTMGHLVLLDEGALGLSWAALPDGVADVFAWIVLAGCAYFAWRRMTLAQVKFVTSASDFVILCIVAAPFLTGVMAYHGWGRQPAHDQPAHACGRDHAGGHSLHQALAHADLLVHARLHRVRVRRGAHGRGLVGRRPRTITRTLPQGDDNG